MKTNYFLITFISFFALIFLSSNSTSKNANINNNKVGQINNAAQQKINQTDTIVTDLDLFKTFKELTNSDAFKTATLTEYDWSSIYDRSDTYNDDYEIINQKDNDFIVLFIWQMVGKEDTISFQKLKETADYTIYAYNENGKTESPFLYHSGFFVFKQYKNGNWETLDLKEINSGIGTKPYGRVLGIYAYKPENKTLYVHKTEDYTDAGETFQRAGRIEQKFVWSDTQEDFIYSKASDLPNPILIHGDGFEGGTENTTTYNAYIETGYYDDDQLKNEDVIEFAIEYERAKDNKRIEIDDKTKNDIINNKDDKQLIWIKYKSEKVLDYTPMGPTFETEVNIIEDYEVLWQNPVIATFTGYEIDDFFAWYEFTSQLGYKYYFNEINSNKYTLCDEETDKANPEFIGKKFKIIFHTELVDDEFGGGKSEDEVIDSIELINN